MRIAIGLMKHESNSFNPQLTTIEDFIFKNPTEVLSERKGIEDSSLQGMIEFFTEKGVEYIPIGLARAVSEGGFVLRETYEIIKSTLLEGLKKAKNIDGICLDLHGSMTVEGLGDAEGDLLATIKKEFGTNIPIVCALDLHAMVTKKMVKNADGFVGYRTAPHIDKVETGRRAAELLYNMLKERYSLSMALCQIPMLVSGEQSETEKEPMASLLNEVKKIEEIPQVLTSSLFLGFPWADVSYNFCSALVVTREDAEQAKNLAIELANTFWAYHQKFTFTTEAYSMEKAIEMALRKKAGPIFICDSGDNPGAGGSAEITYPLECLLRYKVKRALVSAIADAKAFKKCADLKEGEEIELTLGKRNVLPNIEPFYVRCRVKKSGYGHKSPAVVVEIEGIDVVIVPRKMMMTDPAFLLDLGLHPDSYHIVVLKSGYLDPRYEKFSKETFLALTPGYTNQNFSELNFKNIPRPIYPLDKDFDFKAQTKVILSTT